MTHTIRTVLSALAIVSGAICVIGWSLGSLMVGAVTSGDVVARVAVSSMDNPAVTSALSAQVSGRVLAGFERQGVDVAGLGLEGTVTSAVESTIESQAFADEVEAQAAQAREQIERELTRDGRPPGPLVLSFDVSGVINDRLQGIPIVGLLVPEVTVESVEYEAVDADTFETARTSYGWAVFASQWGLWLSLALLASGLLISQRRRWFLAKFALAVGVFAAVTWAVATWSQSGDVTSLTPDQVPTSLGEVLGAALQGETAQVIADRAAFMAIIALVVAVVLGAIAWATTPGGVSRHHR
ncbi:MAG: hypothetical protein WDZ57_02630 [Demequina sp.]